MSCTIKPPVSSTRSAPHSIGNAEKKKKTTAFTVAFFGFYAISGAVSTPFFARFASNIGTFWRAAKRLGGESKRLSKAFQCL